MYFSSSFISVTLSEKKIRVRAIKISLSINPEAKRHLQELTEGTRISSRPSPVSSATMLFPRTEITSAYEAKVGATHRHTFMLTWQNKQKRFS